MEIGRQALAGHARPGAAIAIKARRVYRLGDVVATVTVADAGSAAALVGVKAARVTYSSDA